MRASADKRSKLERQRERDISEQIALGIAKPAANSGEVQFDQRLFNQSQGVSSGFGEDDDYAVYDKPWRLNAAIPQTIYRPRAGSDKDTYGDELENLASGSSKFVPDKSFEGIGRSHKRDGQFVFEKTSTGKSEASTKEDPLGLDVFLKEVKKASKRPAAYEDLLKKSSVSSKGGNKIDHRSLLVIKEGFFLHLGIGSSSNQSFISCNIHFITILMVFYLS